MLVAIATIGLVGCNQPATDGSTNADSTTVDSAKVDTSGVINTNLIKE